MNDDSAGEPRPPQFTLGALFVLIGVIALLLGLMLPAIQAAREAARRLQCENNLRSIGLALTFYHDAHRAFLPASTLGPEMQPWSSWRVALTPFLESNPFWDQYRINEPWNSRANMELGKFPFSHYQCPSEPAIGLNTSCVALVGPETAWSAPHPSHIKEFAKGASSTILVAEMSESGIHWMEPRDLQFDQMEFRIYAPSRPRRSSGRGLRQALSSVHPGGAHVVFADGAVDFLSVDTSSEALKEMLLIGKGGKDAGDGGGQAETAVDSRE